MATHPPALLGYLSERSTRHVAGWVHDPAAIARRVAYDVVCTANGSAQILASGIADQFNHALSLLGVGDARYAFRLHLPQRITEQQRDSIEIRPRDTGIPLPHDPNLRPNWEPLTHVAMDIVDNCNLRCPFCLYDYRDVHRTNLMTPEIYAATLRLLPYVGPGHFWLSCLHEPTLHPRFADMIEAIPDRHRNNVFYTTNLAKRMPPAYYRTLAESGLNHINVSIESLDPAIYERMRKGAKRRIFAENWEQLLEAFAAAPNPPRLRYIAMAYKSNLAELPGLADHLLRERHAWNVEIRDTYDMPHLPAEFRAAEFLSDADWHQLRAALAHHPVQHVTIAGPEPAHAPEIASGQRPPGLAGIRISHEGNMVLKPAPDFQAPNAPRPRILMNIMDIADVERFLTEGWLTRIE